MDHRVVVAACTLAAVLVGCGGGRGVHGGVAAPDTGRFAFTITANGSNRTGLLRASGSFDDDRGRVSLVVEASGFVPGLDGPVAIVAVPDALYLDCPYLRRLLGVPTTWMKVTGAAPAGFRDAFLDPLRLLDLARGVGRGRDQLVPHTTMRFADGAEGGAEDGDVLISVEDYAVGLPVVIEPPAAAEVTDETDAIKRLFGGTTGG